MNPLSSRSRWPEASLGPVGLYRMVVVLAWWFLASPLAALQPNYRAGDYAVQGWQTEDGLPGGRVHAVLQSRDGYLWVATSQGLARFDGNRFVIYDSSVDPELTNPLFYDIAETADGALWFAANGGLFRLREGQIKRFTEADGLITNSMRALRVTRSGELYIGATRGRSFFVRGERVILQEGGWEEVANSVRSYQDRGNGVHLVGTVSGLWQITGDKVEKLSSQPEFPASEAQALKEEPDGTLWIGSNIGVRRIRPDGTITDFGAEQGLENTHVQSLFCDRDGSLWIGTSGGLFRLRDERIEAARYPGRIGSATIFDICEDREGALWIGSSAGLFRLKNAPFHSIGSAEGLAHTSAYAICESRDGSFWIGTMGGGVYRYDERYGAVHLPTPPEMNLDLIHSLYEEPDGTLWIGSHAGFARYRDGVFTDFYEREGDIMELREQFAAITSEMVLPKIIHARISAIISDGEGGLWIAANGALYRYKDGVFRGYTERDGLPPDSKTMRSVFRTRNGDLWVTTTGGPARLRDGVFTLYTTADGLAHNNTRSIYEGNDGSLWISTESGGLNRLKDGRWRGYTTKDGLFDDTCGGMLEDDAGFLWMGSTRGIMRTAIQDFDDFDAKRIPLLRPRLFTRHDGMPSSACNLEGSPNALKTSDGRLRYPTARGIAIVDPRDVTLNTVIPPVYVENFVVNGVETDLSRPVVIPPGENDVQITYTAISLLAPEKVRFKVRLLPRDRDWHPVTARRDMNYANLPPDDYVLRVIACNSDGIWNEQGASLAFTVRPFFHQTAWFRTAAILSVLGIGLVTYRRRVRRIRRRTEELRYQNAELERRIAERTAELARTNENLRSSEYFYHSLVESLPQIIVRKDTDGRFTYANAPFAELVGCPPRSDRRSPRLRHLSAGDRLQASRRRSPYHGDAPADGVRKCRRERRREETLPAREESPPLRSARPPDRRANVVLGHDRLPRNRGAAQRSPARPHRHLAPRRHGRGRQRRAAQHRQRP
jgi:ligand-binding sensor domain-containing protein/PAS domain-containing protein